MMHVLNYCLFLYFRHNLNKRQNFSNTTCRCRLCKLGLFQYIFCQYSIIWIQLTFYFFNFIIRWSILGSTFLSKSLCIYNDIKKVIQYFWIDIFELIWNLIFPENRHIRITLFFYILFKWYYQVWLHIQIKLLNRNKMISNGNFINPSYSAPSKNQIFRNFFWILNMFAIVSNLQKKILIFVKITKNNFSDPLTTNPNKTRRKHFWSSVPQKNPTKLTIPYKMVSLLRYFFILLFMSCT